MWSFSWCGGVDVVVQLVWRCGCGRSAGGVVSFALVVLLKHLHRSSPVARDQIRCKQQTVGEVDDLYQRSSH